MQVHCTPFAVLAAHRGALVVPDGATARALDHALALARQGPVWRAASVTTWPTLAMQAFEDALLAGIDFAGDAEFVLGPEQELALWAEIVAADDTPVASAAAAELARDAWRTLQLWQVPWPPADTGHEDIAAFQRWSAAFIERCAALRVIDGARLLAAAAWPTPSGLLAHGFIAPPPALEARLRDASPATPAVGGARAVNDAATFAARAFADRELELATALAWAAETAERAPAARVVVAFDGLRQEAAQVRRCVRAQWGREDAVHLAVTDSLQDDPRVRVALSILELGPTVAWQPLSRLLTSACLDGVAAERDARARVDLALRRLGRVELPVETVLAALADPAHPCPRLAAGLAAVVARQRAAPSRQSLRAWLEHFAALLGALGWPGEAPHDSATRRLQHAWNEVGDRLQRLDAVLPAQRADEARGRLRRLLTAASPGGPVAAGNVFVVPPATAAALAPDHLWLLGCESGALVGGARPSPCLPLAGQRQAGVPGADAARDLARARLLLGVLAAGSGTRIASYRAGDGEQAVTPSPLLPALRRAELEVEPPALPPPWRQPRAVLESLDDSRVSALSAGHLLAGGVRVLSDQAACPFRALVHHRLRARALEEPAPGLSAADRGNTVHDALAAFWRRVGTQAALLALGPAERAEVIDACARAAASQHAGASPLEAAVAVVERARLVTVLTAWLDYECGRAPFTVDAIEEDQAVEFDGLRLRIRVDRVDRLEDGSRVVIDYKTGRTVSTKAWLTPRLDEPQLPFYALAGGVERVGAVAFARVDPRKPAWLASSSELWDEDRAAWQADLAGLAAEIRTGAAPIAPKRGGVTCALCDCALVCRVRAGVDLDEADLEMDAEEEGVVDEH